MYMYIYIYIYMFLFVSDSCKAPATIHDHSHANQLYTKSKRVAQATKSAYLNLTDFTQVRMMHHAGA